MVKSNCFASVSFEKKIKLSLHTRTHALGLCPWQPSQCMPNILDELTLNYGTEFLVDMFRDADADLTIYKNAVCWAFIELVAIEAVEDQRHEYASSYA